MADRRNIERLIHEVTERVLARIGASPDAPEQPARRRGIELMLPRPVTRLDALCRQAEQLRQHGHPLRVLASEAALAQLDGAGVKARLGPQVARLDQALAPAETADVLVLGSVGFALARRLIGLEDDDAFVRRMAAGMLGGCPLIVLGDDLQSAPGRSENALTTEARRLQGELQRLGAEVLALADLSTRIERLNASDTTLQAALAELVTEADVEGAVRSGLRSLTLAPRTIVTPLARSRAAELGLELIEDQG